MQGDYSEIWTELINADCESKLDAFLKRIKSANDSGFSSYVKDYIKHNSISSATVQKKSYIERSYFYQILRGNKNPGRDKVISIALAAGMSLNEAQEALHKAGGWSLWCLDPRDCVIIYAISKSLSISETNSLLEHYGEGRLD